MTLTQVNSAGIADGAIVNADINNSAAVALSKLATSGTASSSNYLRGDGAWSAIDLSTKLNLTGGTLTGNVIHNDSVKALFGTGSDLQIYHDGNSRIQNTNNSCDFRIQSDAIELKANSVDEMILKGVKDGAVELYYDNSKKFETKTDGILVAGEVQSDTLDCNGNAHIDGTLTLTNNLFIPDDKSAHFGTGNDMYVYHDGSNSFIVNNTGNLYIQGDSNSSSEEILIRPKQGEQSARFIANAAVELYYDNSKKFETTSTGATVTGSLNLGSGDLLLTGNVDLEDSTGAGNNRIKLGASDELAIYHDQNTYSYFKGTNIIVGEGNTTIYWRATEGENSITSHHNGNTELYYDNSKKLETYSGGVYINDTLFLHDNQKVTFGHGSDLQIYHDGTDNIILSNGASCDLLTYVANGELAVKAVANSHVSLYYDNSQKFYTQSDKCVVAGHF